MKFSDRRLMLLVLLVAMTARLLYFITASGETWDTPILDADTNLRIAQEFLRGWPDEPFWQPPLYPAVLALFQRFSPSLWPPRWLIAALSSVTAVFSFSLARRLQRSRAEATFAGLIVALHGPLIFYDGELLPTSLGTFFATAALWTTLYFPASPKRSLASGVLVGLASLSVGPLLLLLLPLALACPPHRPERRRHLLALLTGATLVLAPVLRQNRSHGGGAVIALSGGLNLWIGNNPSMNELVAVRPGAAWETLVEEPARSGDVHSPRDYDTYFIDKVLRFCSQTPGICLQNFLEKGRQFLNGSEIPRNENLLLERTRSPVLSALLWRVGPFAFPWGFLCPLMIVGIFSLRKYNRNQDQFSIIVFYGALLMLVAGPLLFFVAGRYRVPVVPVAAVFAAIGARELARSSARREKIGVLLVGVVFALWPLHLPVERVNFEAERSYLVAGALLRRGDEQGAEAALREALRSRPEYVEAAVNLGGLYAKQGRREEAKQWVQEALRFAPEDPVAQRLWGQLKP